MGAAEGAAGAGFLFASGRAAAARGRGALSAAAAVNNRPTAHTGPVSPFRAGGGRGGAGGGVG